MNRYCILYIVLLSGSLGEHNSACECRNEFLLYNNFCTLNKYKKQVDNLHSKRQMKDGFIKKKNVKKAVYTC